jgi:hypothetical protein
MSMRVANGAMAVLGGSGYMKDYAVERHLRDSRITTIYEGTSQLQVIAAIAGATTGVAAESVKEILGDRVWPHEIEPLVTRIHEGLAMLAEAVSYVKTHSAGNSYRDLYARKLVDMATFLVIGALFCDHATAHPRKLLVARHWLADKLPQIRMLKERVLSGDTLAVDEFETLAGPLPVVD